MSSLMSELLKNKMHVLRVLEKTLDNLNQPGGKVSEKKIGIESLERSLSNKDIIKELERNTELDNDQLKWRHVFASLESYFEKETKNIKAPNKGTDNKKIVFNLVQRVVSLANRDPDRPYLEMASLLQFILGQIDNPVTLEIFGPQLISLIQTFLSIPLYTALMNGSNWIEFIERILRMLEKQNQVPKLLVLEVLNTAIVHGSNHPSVIPLLRTRVLKYFEKSFSKDKDFRLMYMEGFLRLCKHNAVEFRGLLCKVGEAIFPQILYNIATDDEKEKACELFLIQLKLHMPCDVKSGSPAFFCDDVPKWLKTINSVNEFCLDSIGEIAQKRKQRNPPKAVKITQNLLLLSVKCTAQISNLSSTNELNDENVQPPVKKSKSSKTFKQIIHDTCGMSNEAEQSIWLYYIRAVLDQFPGLIESAIDFTALMNTATNLLTSTTAVMTDIFLFLRCLIHCEEHLLKTGVLKEKSASWNYVWDLVIRSLSVNETKAEALQLLESILVKFKPTHVKSLLSLYLNDSLPLEKYSLNLLWKYLLNYTLPSSVSTVNSSKLLIRQMNETSWCPRLLLLQWLMPNCDSDCDRLISVLQCALLVKRTNLLLVSEDSEYQQSAHEMSCYEEFENVFITCSFESSLSTAIDDVSTGKKSTTTDSKLISLVRTFVDSNTTVVHYLGYLQRDYENLPTTESNMTVELLKRLRQLLFRVKTYLHLLNYLEKYNIEASDIFNFKSSVEKLFNASIKSYLSKVNTFFSRKSQLDDNALTVVCGIRSLLQIQLCSGTKNLLILNFPKVVMDLLFKKGFNTTQNEIDDEGNCEEIRRRNAVSLQILQCLCDFGLVSSCDSRVDLFEEIISYCNSLSFSLINQHNFDLCAELLVRLTPELASFPTLTNPIFELLKLMFRAYHKNKVCMAKMWEIATKLVVPINTLSSNTCTSGVDPPKVRLMGLIGSGLSIFLNDHQDLQTWQRMLVTMSQLAKNDCHLSWSSCLPRKGTITNYFPLLELYRHLSIRSHQSSQIQGNFATKLSYKLAEELFKNVYQAVVDSFQVPRGLSPAETVEEEANCVASALLCLGRIIFSSGYIQQLANFHFVLLVKSKAIDINVSHRALKCSHPKAFEITTYNVRFLLEKWLDEQKSIKDFPFRLLDCPDYDFFLKKFQDHIVVRLFELDRAGELEELAKHFKVTSQSLIKKNFCKIISRQTALHTSRHQSNGERSSALHVVHSQLVKAVGGPDQFRQLLSDYCGDIILEECSLLFNPAIPSKWGYAELSIPQPKPTYLTEEGILNSLHSLKDTMKLSGNSVIDNLAVSSPQVIHRILITLARQVHEAYDVVHRFQTLYHFSFFVQILMDERESTFALTKDFACHFILHAYLRFLTFTDPADQHDHFLRAVVIVLSEMIGKLVVIIPKEFEYYYRRMICKLTAKVSTHPHLADVLKPPLDCLLVLNRDKFSACIASLDPFPEEVDLFQDYRKIHREERNKNSKASPSLFTELKTCLVEIKNSDNICTKERLQYIRKLLIEGQEEFAVIIKGLEKKRFHDECAEDLIHNLIQLLLEIINKTEDEGVRNEAARCLGEMGPIELSILVLPSHGSETKLVSTTNIVPTMIEMINTYLADDDITVAETASNVLTNLLTHSEFHGFVKNPNCDRRLQSLLRPFLQPLYTAGETMENVSVNLLKAKLQAIEVNISYAAWITNLTCGLSSCFLPQGSVIAKLQPLCTLKAEFCEDILPFIVKAVLQNGRSNPQVRQEITAYFRNFFHQFVQDTVCKEEPCRNISPSLTIIGRQCSIFKNKLALKCLLRVVQYLRVHDIPEEFKRSKCTTPWDNNFWLDLNYMDVAKVAQYCGAYLSSIMYIEIFALENELTPEDMILSSSEEERKLFVTTDVESLNGTRTKSFNIYKLLLKAYTSIGEEDGVYGCGSARFADFQSSLQHLEQLQRWDQVLYAVDSHGMQNETITCVSLKNLGLYNSLWTHLRGIEARDGSINDELKDVQYECGWRLANWEINSDKVNSIDTFNIDSHGSGGPFQKFLYQSIQTGLKGDRSGYEQNIRRGFNVVVEDLKHASLESSENLYNFLSQFQMLRVIEDVFESDEKYEVNIVSRKWENRNLWTLADFKYQEPVLYMKKTLLSAIDTKHSRTDLTDACNDILFDLLIKARNNGRLELSEKYASEITELMSMSNATFVKKQLEIARNHWVRGSQDIAKHILDKLIQKQSPEACQFYPRLLLQYGQWLYDTVAEQTATVFQKYLTMSCQLLEKKQDRCSSEMAEAFVVVAKYADAQYQKLVDYMQSDLYREKKVLYNKAKEEQAKTQQQSAQDTDTRKSLHFMRKQTLMDNEEIQNTIVEKARFRNVALSHYMRALNYSTSTEYDLLIFRCIALWLENGPSGDGEQQANKIVSEEPMAAYKYIGVLHQLSARLGSSNVVTTELINKIILKCAELHPFHTLPVILTQAMLYKDKEIISKSTNRKSVVSGQERIAAAANILDRLRKSKTTSQLTAKMEKLWEALIAFANTQEVQKGEQRKLIPPTAMISTLKSLENIPVPTLNLPVVPNGNYDNIIGINSLGKYYHLVGGINSPKKLTCIGTNGQTYNMLLKGNDDLRQDAVMQQVFSAMNAMLSTEPKTKKRRLLVRTYKVVPLSQRSGVIEWCENTQTFGDYLIGGGPSNVGAHALYRPSDYKALDCRKMMMEVKDCGDVKKKHSTFLKMMEKFKPVFRHFFFDNFKDAGSFFERRLAYTRSVATSSMVGYVLGVGDRHVLNILVDRKTAEFIHIDLGVAFDQGQHLPTPETIPFRLSRDVVDGMGVSGTEGVFRRSCEMTLEVLRKHSDIILTILEVLLYDPLYLWTLTEDRKQRIQPVDSRTQIRNSSVFGELETEQRNNSAARELRRLRCKLAGIHEGGASGTSMNVPSQVAILIQHAVDTTRLCRLFPGWQPYL